MIEHGHEFPRFKPQQEVPRLLINIFNDQTEVRQTQTIGTFEHLPQFSIVQMSPEEIEITSLVETEMTAERAPLFRMQRWKRSINEDGPEPFEQIAVDVNFSGFRSLRPIFIFREYIE